MGTFGIKSLYFVIFVAAVFVCYFAGKNAKWQQGVTLCADIFVVWKLSGKRGLIGAAVLVLVVYFCGKNVEKYRANAKNKAKIWYRLGVIFSIGTLLYYKFFTKAFDALINSIKDNTGISLIALVAPVGVSYYSLSLAAYLYDVYHKKCDSEKNFLCLMNYALFFPALIEGPFNLYKELMPKLKEYHKFDFDRMVYGAMRLLWGYFKKVVIADRIGIIVIAILSDENSAGVLLFWGMVLYTFQLYADFSGGIDVIMGVSEIMGIELPENFRSPIISRSVTEFWQRWHMTLGTIMEKYLYYPIVLSKPLKKISKKFKSKYLQKTFSASFGAFLVFIVVGIWHGTGWNYVVYGIYQACFTSTAILFKPGYAWLKKKFHVNEESISWKIFTVLRTFTILVFGRYFIKAANLAQSFLWFKKTFTALNLRMLFDGTMLNYGLNERNMNLMYLCIILLIIVDILHEKGMHFRVLLMKQDIVFRYFIYFVGLFSIIIFGIYGPAYEPSNFIYAQF